MQLPVSLILNTCLQAYLVPLPFVCHPGCHTQETELSSYDGVFRNSLEVEFKDKFILVQKKCLDPGIIFYNSNFHKLFEDTSYVWVSNILHHNEPVF